MPVARLVPLTGGTDLRCDRPATKRPAYTGRARVHSDTPTAELVGDLRGDR